MLMPVRAKMRLDHTNPTTQRQLLVTIPCAVYHPSAVSMLCTSPRKEVTPTWETGTGRNP